MKLNEAWVPRIDPQFEEVTEGEEPARIDALQSKWAAIAAIVGDPERIELVAQDIVDHFEQRDRAMTRPGKAMIVCMSRDICVRMHDALVRLRPEWHHPDDDQGALKVVMTGSAADGPEWQEHIRNKPRRKALADRFRDDSTGFKLVIVRDMWLTGFDAPSLHTMYVDKPMRGHNLMQAIARVNRVYPGKDGGLVVAYLPLQKQLQEALQDYTDADQELSGRLQDEAAHVMKEKFEIVKAMFHGFDYAGFATQSPAARLTTLSNAVDFILQGREENRNRYIDNVTALGQAYALANPHPDGGRHPRGPGLLPGGQGPAREGRGTSDVGPRGLTPPDIELAVQEIVDRAVAPDGIVDLFDVAGLEQPNISLLSDEFLLEVQMLPQKNVAVELLRRLIEGEIKERRRTNLVQARSFAEMLKRALDRYNDQAIAAAVIIDELHALAQEMQEAQDRGEDLGLNSDELAFYDALAANESAVDVMGDEQLALIARELVTPCGATPPSTGPCRRAPAPRCAPPSSASCAATATRPTCKPPPRAPSCNRPNCSPARCCRPSLTSRVAVPGREARPRYNNIATGGGAHEPLPNAANKSPSGDSGAGVVVCRPARYTSPSAVPAAGHGKSYAYTHSAVLADEDTHLAANRPAGTAAGRNPRADYRHTVRHRACGIVSRNICRGKTVACART